MKANDVIIKNIATVIRDAGKYVSLDLSGSPLTEIPGSTFRSCKTLAGIIIPNSVTEIGEMAFENCTSLISVTFKGTISATNFREESWSYPTFPGDLRAKYLAGGIGTYTRPNGDSRTWTKQ
jgi:hypothetical protein